MLHVTNGSAFIAMLGDAGIDGETLPWDDVLMHGPVPAGLDAKSLAETRARFIEDCGWAGGRDVAADFHARDARFARAVRDREPIVLWFEPDLHDQLQLIQILDRVAGPGGDLDAIELVQADALFGHMTPADLPGWYARRAPVSPAQVNLAREAFAAFRNADPNDLAAFAAGDTAPLPFLATALHRLLEEYPDAATGLTRIERHALQAVADEPRTGGKVFQAAIEAETHPFEGDWGFLLSLKRLLASDQPLIAFSETAPEATDGPADFPWRTPLMATEFGTRVASGEKPWPRIAGEELWRGGVCISEEQPWRFDASSGRPARRPGQAAVS